MTYTPDFWGDDALLVRMQRGWDGGLPEGTPCGNGSLSFNTKKISEWLPQMVAKYDIRSLADAGAGDMHWQRHLRLPLEVEYRPFDLVPRKARITAWDITKERLPECDAILCRHVLIHFDAPRIERTLELFRRSAKYLFASQYDSGTHSWRPFNRMCQYNPTDLRPLLGQPRERCPDADEGGQYLAMFDLQPENV